MKILSPAQMDLQRKFREAEDKVQQLDSLVHRIQQQDKGDVSRFGRIQWQLEITGPRMSNRFYPTSTELVDILTRIRDEKVSEFNQLANKINAEA